MTKRTKRTKRTTCSHCGTILDSAPDARGRCDDCEALFAAIDLLTDSFGPDARRARKLMDKIGAALSALKGSYEGIPAAVAREKNDKMVNTLVDRVIDAVEAYCPVRTL